AGKQAMAERVAGAAGTVSGKGASLASIGRFLAPGRRKISGSPGRPGGILDRNQPQQPATDQDCNDHPSGPEPLGDAGPRGSAGIPIADDPSVRLLRL